MLASAVWVWGVALLAEGWRIPGQWWGVIPGVCAGTCLIAMIRNRILDPLLGVVVASGLVAVLLMATLWSVIAFVTGGGEWPGGDRGVWSLARTAKDGEWIVSVFEAVYDGEPIVHVRVASARALGLGWHVVEPGVSLGHGEFGMDTRAGTFTLGAKVIPWEMQWLGWGSAVVYAVVCLCVGASWLARERVRTLCSRRVWVHTR